MDRDPEELPALPLDQERIFASLAAHRVEYVLVGGAAVLAHGIGTRETFDLDLVPRLDEANLDRLGQALRDLHARVVTVWDAERQELHVDDSTFEAAVFINNPVLHVMTDAGRMDVMARAPGAEGGFDQLAGTARARMVGPSEVPVAAVADLIRMKEAIGRPRDLADLALLRSFQG